MSEEFDSSVVERANAQKEAERKKFFLDKFDKLSVTQKEIAIDIALNALELLSIPQSQDAIECMTEIALPDNLGVAIRTIGTMPIEDYNISAFKLRQNISTETFILFVTYYDLSLLSEFVPNFEHAFTSDPVLNSEPVLTSDPVLNPQNSYFSCMLIRKIQEAFSKTVISKMDLRQFECFLSLRAKKNFYDLEELFFGDPNLNAIVDYCSLGGCSFDQFATFLCTSIPSWIIKMNIHERERDDDTESLPEPHLNRAIENDL